MAKTIFITGASSGFGKLTAKLFASKGWNVVATMRNPNNEKELNKLNNVLVTKLDVTNEKTIKSSVLKAIKKFDRIDVLFNNAGFGVFGFFEEVSTEKIDKQMNTNFKGSLLVAKEIIPFMRKQNSGTIINVSSIAGLVGLPIGSLYCASKFAIEGWSESLRFELDKFNIKVKLIEPGNFKTNFQDKINFTESNPNKKNNYSKFKLKTVSKDFFKGHGLLKQGKAYKVANTVWKISNSKRSKFRHVVGRDAKTILLVRKILGRKVLYHVMKKTVGKKLK